MNILWWNKEKGSYQINEHIVINETKKRAPTKSMNILWLNKVKGSNQINEKIVMKQRKGLWPNQWTYCD